MEKLAGFELCYLATPYTKYATGHEMAFRDAARLASRIQELGINVYSPIVHGHPMCSHGVLPAADYSVWRLVNLVMMKRTDALLIGQLPSWTYSSGIRDEVHEFKMQHKPIFYIDPETMNVTDFR